MVDWNMNSFVHCCALAVQSEIWRQIAGEIHAGRLFIGHHSALRHRGDGPKTTYGARVMVRKLRTTHPVTA
jgi:hypothetical protein